MAEPIPITTLVFDFGGVLIDWDPRYAYRAMGGTEEEIEHFLTHVATHEWNARLDAGLPYAEAVIERAEAFPEHAEWLHAYHERWSDMLGGAIEGTVEVLADLRERGVPLYGLTNWSAETFPVAQERFGFIDWFDGVVVSGEVRLIKPDAQIYHHLVDTFDVVPETALFIDDRAENVEAAERLGFRGHHFHDPAALRRHLEALGLL